MRLVSSGCSRPCRARRSALSLLQTSTTSARAPRGQVDQDVLAGRRRAALDTPRRRARGAAAGPSRAAAMSRGRAKSTRSSLPGRRRGGARTRPPAARRRSAVSSASRQTSARRADGEDPRLPAREPHGAAAATARGGRAGCRCRWRPGLWRARRGASKRAAASAGSPLSRAATSGSCSTATSSSER